MPSRKSSIPEHFVPSERALLTTIRQRPGLSLRELCAEVWPDLPWAPAAGKDSATGRIRGWQVPPRPGVAGNRVQKATAAAWLAEQLQDLCTRGLLRCGPRRRDEVDLLAGVTYLPASAAARLPGEGHPGCDAQKSAPVY